MKLSQTLAGDWVITIPNPEEAHWETELASFAISATAPGSPAARAIETAAAAAFVSLATSLGAKAPRVTSHDPVAAARMVAESRARGLDPC